MLVHPYYIVFTLQLLSLGVVADTISKDRSPAVAVSTLGTDELAGFDTWSQGTRKLITEALALTRKNLTYTFGSSDPSKGGMDCSGTVYRLLQDCGYSKAPRQSDEICDWVREAGKLHVTPGVSSFNDAAFASLQPGDLVFWSSTYASSKRDLPVTHVMVYIGKRKENGKPLLFGASDGRSYEGQRRCGVSVFDFAIPKPGGKAAIYGYGSIPGIK